MKNVAKQRAHSITSESELPGNRVGLREIQEELERILSSPRFRRSRRMSRYLTVLVKHAMKEDGPLGAHEIAAEVFDRANLDPKTDPIVRVEARRLRHFLEEYYHKEGFEDPVVISIPNPGYTPRFSRNNEVARGNGSSESGGGAHRRSSKSIVVLPFLNMTNNPRNEAFCEGVTEELTNALTRIDDLKVASRTSAFQYKDPRDIRDIGKQLGVSAVLEGSVRMADDRVRVTAQLTSADDGFHLCSETFDADFEQSFALQERLATAIAAMTGSRL